MIKLVGQIVKDTGKEEHLEELANLRQQVEVQTALYEASHFFLERIDVTTALNQACRLAVERFGAKMAWIGQVVEDSFKIKPVASYGFKKDYLDSLEITWDDSLTGQGPTGIAIKTGQTIAMNQIDTDPAFLPWRAAALECGYKSSAALPLCYSNETLGAINVYSVEADFFSPDTLQLFQSFANLVAVALERAYLYEQVQNHAVELEHRVETSTKNLLETNQKLHREITERKQAETERARFINQLRTAAEVSNQLTAILDIEQLLYNVVSLLQSRFNLYHVHVYLLNKSGDDLIMRMGSGEIGRQLRLQKHHISLKTEHSLVTRAARTTQIIAVENVHAEPDFLPNPLLPETHTELAIPLIMAGKVVGVLDVQDNVPHHFTPSDLDVFSALAGQIATALNNAHLFEEQKKTGAALRESEQRFRTVADFTYDWEYWIDPQGNLIYVSPSCERVTGYQPDEFQENPQLLRQIVLPDDLERVTTHLEKEMVSNEPASIEFRIVSKDGRERWMGHACQPVYGPNGNKLGRRASNRDVTEQKHAENALWHYTTRLETLHQIDRDILAAQQPETIARVALDHVRDMLPCVRASVVEFNPVTGQAQVLAVHVDGETKISKGSTLPPNAMNMAVLEQGEAYISNNLLEQKDLLYAEEAILAEGICSYVNVPLLIRDELIGALNVGSDVPNAFTTDHLDIVEEVATSLAIAIQQANLYEQAQEDAETKAVLLREVNHRVKNNLAAIVGLLYAERNHAGMEQQDTYQAIISDLINRIEGLATVHRMLSASLWTPLRLSDLVDQVAHSIVQTLTSDKNVSINISAANAVFVTPKQANSLAMIINEMITNTVKYALKDRQTASITASIFQEDNNITLKYQDDGPGFPQAVIEQKQKNVGMYLLHNLVRNDLRGEVTLQNNNGAVITICFKAAKEGGV